MERYGYEENLKLWRGQLDEAKDEQGRPPGHFFLSLQVGLYDLPQRDHRRGL